MRKTTFIFMKTLLSCTIFLINTVNNISYEFDTTSTMLNININNNTQLDNSGPFLSNYILTNAILTNEKVHIRTNLVDIRYSSKTTMNIYNKFGKKWFNN